MIFLDRDDTINVDPGYVFRTEDFRFMDRALEGLLLLASLDFQLVVVSNQSGIALGLYSLSELRRFNEHLRAKAADVGIVFAAFYYCQELDLDSLPEGGVLAECSKPNPGMLIEAGEELGLELSACWMVGDRWSDVEAGRRVGARTILLTDCPEDVSCSPDYVCRNLVEAAAVIKDSEVDHSAAKL